MKAPQYLSSFTSSPSNVLQRCFSRWFGYEAQGLSGNLNNRGDPALSPTTAFRLEAGSSEDGLFPPWEVPPPSALCLAAFGLHSVASVPSSGRTLQKLLPLQRLVGQKYFQHLLVCSDFFLLPQMFTCSSEAFDSVGKSFPLPFKPPLAGLKIKLA